MLALRFPMAPLQAKLALSVCLLTASAFAQITTPRGFTVQRHGVAPAGVIPGGFDLAPSGNLVLFDGTAILELDRSGTFLRTVYSGLPTFGSFLRFSSDGSKLYFGESGAGDILEIAWPAGTARVLTTIDFNYDAAVDPQGALFVSANPGFAGQQILRVDPLSGATDRIATLPGASGPIAFDATGNLYCMDVPAAFPPPPGAFAVLRFSAAQVLSAIGAGELQAAQAAIIRPGLNGGSNFAWDGEGRLLLSTGTEVLALDSGGNAAQLVQAGPSDYLGVFAFARGDTPFFRGYGARSGGALVLTSTDFFSFYDVVEVTPSRPALVLDVPNPVPVGPVIMSLFGTAPVAPVLMAVSVQSISPEFAVYSPRPFVLGLDLQSLIVLSPLLTNAQGDLWLGFGVPPGAHGFASSWQAIVFDAQGPYASSSRLDIVLQ